MKWCLQSAWLKPMQLDLRCSFAIRIPRRIRKERTWNNPLLPLFPFHEDLIGAGNVNMFGMWRKRYLPAF
jgi:hypothetical protein